MPFDFDAKIIYSIDKTSVALFFILCCPKKIQGHHSGNFFALK